MRSVRPRLYLIAQFCEWLVEVRQIRRTIGLLKYCHYMIELHEKVFLGLIPILVPLESSFFVIGLRSQEKLLVLIINFGATWGFSGV